MTDLELRKEAAETGVIDTGQYIEWLEERVLSLRRKHNCNWAACALEKMNEVGKF